MKPKRILSQPWDLMEFALLHFGLLCSMSPLPSFLFLPSGIRMSILGLPDHFILEAHKLSDFTGSQLERDFASGFGVPRVSPISDLDGS